MMECILKELVARVQQASQDENLQKAAKAALWTNAEGAWLYKRWDPQAKSLVTMETPPLTATALLHTLEELLQDVRTTDGLRKFHASRPLTQELANQAMDQDLTRRFASVFKWRCVERRGRGCIRISTNCATTWC